MVSTEVAARFMSRFQGLHRAHGQYVIPTGTEPTKRKGNKIEGRAQAEPGGATLPMWEKHLSPGNFGLGIVPIMDDDNVMFGAIDVDVYTLDIPALRHEVEVLKLPLLVCRTKSGGAHLYLFCQKPISAELVRGRLMEWAVILGYSGVEVFPVQISLASGKDMGNWINMPYQGGERTVRYCQGPNGALTMTEFLDAADAIAVTEEALRDFKLPPDERIDQLFFEGPPCLQTLARKMFPEGTRNNAMFNMAVYLRKRHEDDWPDRLQTYNQRFVSPPLGDKEVQFIIKSVRKKNYNYRCKEPPINVVCNRQICLTRHYGVGEGNDDPGVVLGDLVKVETVPPIWIWDVNGARIELTTEQLLDQRQFRSRILEVLTKLINPVSPGTWMKIIRERIEKAEVIHPPIDLTPMGQWAFHLDTFCSGRAQGRNLDELLLGKPFTQNGSVFFRSADVLNYFTSHKVPGVTERKLWTFLKQYGAEHHQTKLKGKTVNYWSMAKFEQQTEAHEVPRISNEGSF